MPEIKSDQPLLPSVLDRLIDNEPDVRREPMRERNQTLRQLKQAVRRDLENLLNTRVRCVPSPPGLKELGRSVVGYGVPDLTGASFGSEKDRKEFGRTLQAIIARYEPRLMNVVVTTESAETLDRTIRYHIDATLKAEPAPEPVQFDSKLRLTTGVFEVEDERGA